MVIALGDYDPFESSILLISGEGKTVAVIFGKDRAETTRRANSIARDLSLSDNGDHAALA